MTNQEQSTEKRTTEQEPASATSTSTSIDTQPGVSALDLDRIRRAYNDVLGELNIVKAHVIEDAIDAGLQTDAILDAIEQTAMARRPSHYYLAAILTRYQSDHLFTKKQIDADRCARRRERFISNRQRWADWYESPEDQLPW